MQALVYFLVPLASAAIGWLTNYLAIKMLFYPRLPYRILGMTFQGIFPKRQKEFAQQLGELVSEKLLSFDDIKDKLVNQENMNSLRPLISDKVEEMIKTKLKDYMPMASMLLGDKKIAKLKDGFTDEIIAQLPGLIDDYMDKMGDSLDIKKLVAEKVTDFDVAELEKLLTDVLGREFRFIEMLGAVIGFLIGLIQLMFMLFVMPAMD